MSGIQDEILDSGILISSGRINVWPNILQWILNTSEPIVRIWLSGIQFNAKWECCSMQWYIMFVTNWDLMEDANLIYKSFENISHWNKENIDGIMIMVFSHGSHLFNKVTELLPFWIEMIYWWLYKMICLSNQQNSLVFELNAAKIDQFTFVCNWQCEKNKSSGFENFIQFWPYKKYKTLN